MTHFTVYLSNESKNTLPYDHNYLLGSAIYKLLKDMSEDAAKILHDAPYRTSYVISEIYRVSGKRGESWFRVGSGNGKVLELLEESMKLGTKIQIGSTVFEVHGIKKHSFSLRPGEYLTLSPILLRDRNTGLSIVHDHPNYVSILQSAINAEVNKYLKKEGSIQIHHFESQAVRKRKIGTRTVLAEKGRFLMSGSVDELKLLVDYGVGLSPALGFGMIVPTEAECNE
ncbi:MAG: hypothetical protein M0Z77_06680 [Thermoplasmatales archaeon]|nr:hypothetical protein [Thermoplasmatales archaeon]